MSNNNSSSGGGGGHSSIYVNSQSNIKMVNSTTVRDSDFNLSQTAEEMVTDGTAVGQSTLLAQSELRKGDALYSDCKDAFMDL